MDMVKFCRFYFQQSAKRLNPALHLKLTRRDINRTLLNSLIGTMVSGLQEKETRFH